MFKHRSTKKELLDGEVSKDDLYQNLDELHTINKLLGGYSGSLASLKKVVNKKLVIIMDIGCGGGDMMRFLYENIQPRTKYSYIGVDLKEDCIEYAKTKHSSTPLQFINEDFRDALDKIENVDVVHANLFTHHLTNQEIVDLIDFVAKRNKILIINDLHRHWFAYYSISILTKVLSKSHLVKHDAKLSVLRGFKKRDWFEILNQTEIDKNKIQLKWKWAFRYLIVIDNDG